MIVRNNLEKSFADFLRIFKTCCQVCHLFYCLMTFWRIICEHKVNKSLYILSETFLHLIDFLYCIINIVLLLLLNNLRTFRFFESFKLLINGSHHFNCLSESNRYFISSHFDNESKELEVNQMISSRIIIFDAFIIELTQF